MDEHPWLDDVALVLSFEMRGGGGPAPMTVRSGPVHVDSRVYLDGEPFRHIARKEVREDSARQAHRSRDGRR